MISDVFFQLHNSLKKLFCHHEYVYHSVPYFLELIGYYECKKCGRLASNPPDELVVHDGK